MEHCFTDKTYGTIWMHFEMKCSQYLLNISPLSQTCEINRNLLFFYLRRHSIITWCNVIENKSVKPYLFFNLFFLTFIRYLYIGRGIGGGYLKNDFKTWRVVIGEEDCDVIFECFLTFKVIYRKKQILCRMIYQVI